MIELTEFEMHGLRLIAHAPRDVPDDDQMDSHWEATMALIKLEEQGLVEERDGKVVITEKGKRRLKHNASADGDA